MQELDSKESLVHQGVKAERVRLQANHSSPDRIGKKKGMGRGEAKDGGGSIIQSLENLKRFCPAEGLFNLKTKVVFEVYINNPLSI